MKGGLFITGPAGTGKSTLCGAIKEYLQRNGVDAAVVNLDPGAEFIPYEPDVDIREWISLQDIMSQFNLGPNGAQIVASDLIIENVERIKEITDEMLDYYVIFDTPGQIELFSFRTSSPMIVESLAGKRAMLAFVGDGIVASTPSGFISQKLLFASIMTRFMKPTLYVMNKVDVLEESVLEKIFAWDKDKDMLIDGFMEEKVEGRKDFFYNFINSFEESGLSNNIIGVSARDLSGIDEIYGQMSLYLTGGEDEDTLYTEDQDKDDINDE